MAGRREAQRALIEPVSEGEAVLGNGLGVWRETAMCEGQSPQDAGHGGND